MEKEKISYRQYMFMSLGFLQGSVLVLSFMDSLAQQDSWIVIILSLICSIPFALCYVQLVKWFPGKDLVEIQDSIYGPVIGKIINLFYLLYFLSLLAFNLRDMSDFYTGFILPQTPKLVFLIIFMFVSAYVLKKGFVCIMKVSVLNAIFVVFTALLSFILMIGNMDFSNLLPPFQLPVEKYIEVTAHFSVVPYLEIVVLLSMASSLKSTVKLGRYSIGGMLLATATFLIIIVRNLTVMGLSGRIVDISSYEATRLIDIGGIFTRLELLVALVFTFSLFTKISILYYAMVHCSAQYFKFKSEKSLILPIGALAVFTTLVTYDSTVNHIEFAINYNVALFGWMVFLFPPLSLLIAKIRKLDKAKI